MSDPKFRRLWFGAVPASRQARLMQLVALMATVALMAAFLFTSNSHPVLSWVFGIAGVIIWLGYLMFALSKRDIDWK